MVLDKKQKNLLGRFAAGLTRSAKRAGDKDWLSTFKVRSALEQHPDLVELALDDPFGCMLDDAVRARVMGVVNAIEEPVKGNGDTRAAQVAAKREAIKADLKANPGLSLASRQALVGAICQGLKGEEKTAALAALEGFVAAPEA
jgi:hypothetical protein